MDWSTFATVIIDDILVLSLLFLKEQTDEYLFIHTQLLMQFLLICGRFGMSSMYSLSTPQNMAR